MKKTILIATLAFVAALSPANACNDFQKFFGGCVEAKAAVKNLGFVPTFESVVVYSTPTSIPQPANDRYFATEETAKWILAKFGADHIEIQPAINNLGGRYVFTSGPNTGETAFYRFLAFTPATFLRNNQGEVTGSVSGNFIVNAGVLADEYRRNPEADFPQQAWVYGNPPIHGIYLSNAEQGVWKTLTALSNELAKQKADSEAQKEAK